MSTLKTKRTIESLLRQHGAVLVRRDNHNTWKLPNGKLFFVHGTPSDHRHQANLLAKLKRKLNHVDPVDAVRKTAL